MPIEDSLRFMEGTKSLYYAGLDHESLPFREGERLVRRTAKEQILYLKALSLVSHYVVVPPSFYFYWAHTHQSSRIMSELCDLYQAKIIISPIYTTMNMGTDFLEQKREYGSPLDKRIIQENRNLLVPFYRDMPVMHRNVRRQSGGFRNLLSHDLPALKGPAALRRELDQLIFSSSDKEVLVSREQVTRFLTKFLRRKEINTRQFRQYYYTTNRCYYRQGALTYDSPISLVGAERYSILGPQIFNDLHGILLAYDPLVVIGMLESLGIRRNLLSRLTVQDLVEIRSNPIFGTFCEAYREFAVTLQELDLCSRRVSQNFLSELKGNIRARMLAQFYIEAEKYGRYSSYWNIGEMTFFALALGAVGFFVIPLVGAIMGLIPIVAYSAGLTPRLSNIVIQRLCDKELSFYLFIDELKKVLRDLNEDQRA